MHHPDDVTTGLPALDELLRGIEAGDNIVWQTDSPEDYKAFAVPFATRAIANGRKVVYFRFGRHDPLLEPQAGLIIHVVEPQAGFESFIDSIHEHIAEAGRGAFYVFDCLSDLAADWFSDQMLGNFFMLTCPYLFDLDTVAFFALLRDFHSDAAIVPIRETTQLFLDLYHHEDKTYVRPVKVRQRFFPTMHMLHAQEAEHYHAVTESHILSEVLASEHNGQESSPFRLDVWNRAFIKAEDLLASGASDAERQDKFQRLLRMTVSRDPRVLELAERYFTLEHVLAIGRRTIGTGLIGGKAVGMLLAQAILRKSDPAWNQRLERHDSFYIASDVFYSFLVRNGCWWIRKNQKNPETFLEGASQARRRILTGTFSPGIRERFREMLEYYGRSPIIVRSSSLLEDNFGKAFAGKYESVFCVNQGSPSQRLEELLNAVKTVYASSMSEAALSYRARHGILHLDEQMALLVQRVCGANHGRYFYPHLAGVGFSYNPYAWSPDIDPSAGLVRLVFGLGTRAVDRSDDDYTRILALNAPDLRPEGAGDGAAPHAQHKVDLLDLRDNSLRSIDFTEAVDAARALPLDAVAPVDSRVARRNREMGISGPPPRFLTFGGVLRDTPFVEDMRSLVATLQAAYEYPVDIEFTANLLPEGGYRMSLVQCRPLQIHTGTALEDWPEEVKEDRVLMRSRGPLIGRSRAERIGRIIYVVPEVYAMLAPQDRYAVARLIGRLAHIEKPANTCTLLMGPGRWGTSSPELGVPVSFTEIDTVDIVCEIVAMREDLVPDVSMGTHFFSELVEMDMLYLALFPKHEGHGWNVEAFDAMENRLAELLPDAAGMAHAVRVLDPENVHAAADTIAQRFLCYAR
jgi:hypothetical protein